MGGEFILDPQGNMRIRGANKLQWPLMPPMNSVNGLNVDPAKGLWTAPHGCYRTGSFYSASGLSVALTQASPWTNPATTGGTLKPLTVNNPSSCQSMAVYAWGYSYITVTMPPGTQVSHRASLGYGSLSNTVILGNELNPTGAGSTYGWADRRHIPASYTPHGTLVPPGGSLVLWPNMGATSVGSGTITGWENWTVAQYILLDPTQAGVHT